MLTKLKIIWKNRKEIFQGLHNNFFKKVEIEEVAYQRLEICNSCPNIDRTGHGCLIPGTQPCCSICGCKLALKTRSLASECPHPKGPLWKAVLTQEQEDKLYTDINYNPDK